MYAAVTAWQLDIQIKTMLFLSLISNRAKPGALHYKTHVCLLWKIKQLTDMFQCAKRDCNLYCEQSSGSHRLFPIFRFYLTCMPPCLICIYSVLLSFLNLRWCSAEQFIYLSVFDSLICSLWQEAITMRCCLGKPYCIYLVSQDRSLKQHPVVLCKSLKMCHTEYSHLLDFQSVLDSLTLLKDI